MADSKNFFFDLNPISFVIAPPGAYGDIGHFMEAVDYVFSKKSMEKIQQRTGFAMAKYLSEAVRRRLLNQSVFKHRNIAPLKEETKRRKKRRYRDKFLLDTAKMASKISYAYEYGKRRFWVGVPGASIHALKARIHEYGAIIRKKFGAKKSSHKKISSFLSKHEMLKNLRSHLSDIKKYRGSGLIPGYTSNYRYSSIFHARMRRAIAIVKKHGEDESSFKQVYYKIPARAFVRPTLKLELGRMRKRLNNGLDDFLELFARGKSVNEQYDAIVKAFGFSSIPNVSTARF